jgi:hypothetical protein
LESSEKVYLLRLSKKFKICLKVLRKWKIHGVPNRTLSEFTILTQRPIISSISALQRYPNNPFDIAKEFVELNRFISIRPGFVIPAA